MKKVRLLTMVFLTIVSILSIIGCTTEFWNSPIALNNLQQGVFRFEGDWIVSGYTEGGNETLTYDGDTVRIVKMGNIYSMDGPTWFFDEAKFQLDGTKLVGTIVPDMERLKENWPTAPPAVLGGAYGKIVYRGKLTMLENGLIYAEEDEWKIGFTGNRFRKAKRIPSYIIFILIRKN